MKCDLCNKPAVVHEVTVRSGVKKEVHLCEAHAREAGIVMPGQQPINQLLTQFVISQTSKPTRAANKVCSGCGLPFSQFRQTGRVGCAECYQSFDAELSPLIERAQNGGTHHTGKTPRRAGASIDRQLLIQRLIKELDHAVAAEQYERAAKLRDRLSTMDVPNRSIQPKVASKKVADGDSKTSPSSQS
ncbi:MAG: UvrB/UvrC motif-containing protein [Phycisphaerales bacterium]|nr:UvrB/UvrC motif-containing protein [Phycisphaerales bacterium]MCI0630176.1 UvrB/UvrC motif-containing protein [Phycisphaerales bacterium]MCI0674883.1 UvrB/UvrC motif-containing protein [Phycisphaerales bacterium]